MLNFEVSFLHLNYMPECMVFTACCKFSISLVLFLFLFRSDGAFENSFSKFSAIIRCAFILFL